MFSTRMNVLGKMCIIIHELKIVLPVIFFIGNILFITIRLYTNKDNK